MSRISCHKLSQITVHKWYTYHGPPCCFPKGYVPTTLAHSGMNNGEKNGWKKSRRYSQKCTGQKSNEKAKIVSEWNRSASKSKNTLVFTTKGSMKTRIQNGKADVCHSGLSTSLHEKWSLRACSENTCCPSKQKFFDTVTSNKVFTHGTGNVNIAPWNLCFGRTCG